MSAISVTSMELASGWTIDRVLDATQSKNRLELVQFLKDRYEKRFFEPIALLEREAIRGIPWTNGNLDPESPIRPYGFAIMSLACQMIETLESYRRGIPTTSKNDFSWMTKNAGYSSIPAQFKCDEKTDIPDTDKAFGSFFSDYSSAFPGLKGDEFYRNVRNSLLHQSQTRNGWKLNIHHPDDALSKVSEVFVDTEKILYRDSFVSQLRCCFAKFVEHLAQHCGNDEIWKKPERKIWWIAWLSDQEYVATWLKDHEQDKGKEK